MQYVPHKNIPTQPLGGSIPGGGKTGPSGGKQGVGDGDYESADDGGPLCGLSDGLRSPFAQGISPFAEPVRAHIFLCDIILTL